MPQIRTIKSIYANRLCTRAQKRPNLQQIEKGVSQVLECIFTRVKLAAGGQPPSAAQNIINKL